MSHLAHLQRIEIDEYLEGELSSDVRHEYVAGQVFAMVGASRAHNLIVGNLLFALRKRADSGRCEFYASDMKVRVEAADAYYYPDLAVTCSADESETYFLRCPRLLVEVLSPTTEATDRREKMLAYRRLDCLMEYVLVAQDRRRVEVYRKSDESEWEVERFEGEEAVRLHALELELPMGEIYERVPGVA